LLSTKAKEEGRGRGTRKPADRRETATARRERRTVGPVKVRRVEKAALDSPVLLSAGPKSRCAPVHCLKLLLELLRVNNCSVFRVTQCASWRKTATLSWRMAQSCRGSLSEPPLLLREKLVSLGKKRRRRKIKTKTIIEYIKLLL